MDADTGSLSAHYEYDPYGNMLVARGDAAEGNVFRFSTKYRDETGLYYYGHRFYSPEVGRWTKRNPIAEAGWLSGVNVDRTRHLPSRQRLLHRRAEGVSYPSLQPSAADELVQYVGFLNSPVSVSDALGLKRTIYLMVGHFSPVTNADGTVTGDPRSWIWNQLGTSVANIDSCDMVFSISCHMESFLTAVGGTFPGVQVPADWPPKGCGDCTIYGGDATKLLKSDAPDTVHSGVNSLMDPPCCCEKVEFKIMCDKQMADNIHAAYKVGQIPIDYCDHFSTAYTDRPK